MPNENRDKHSPAPALAFDFNRAAEDARRDYPEETKNITFIDISEEGASEKLARWIASTSPAYLEQLAKGLGVPVADAAEGILFNALLGGGISMKDCVSGKSCLLMSNESGKSLADIMFSLPVEKTNAFAFYHELGHLITPRGMTEKELEFVKDGDDPGIDATTLTLCEISADCFGALKGLRDGFLDADDLKKLIADRRAGDAVHATADALQDILDEYDAHDIASLSPAQLKKAAAARAEKFAPEI